MLGHYRELVYLNLDGSGMGSKQWDRSSRAGSFAGVLAQCRALAHLDLECGNVI